MIPWREKLEAKRLAKIGGGMRLTIEITPKGEVSVGGPLENKLMCYAMLEGARDAIKDYVPEQKPLIEVAPAGSTDSLPAPDAEGPPKLTLVK